ncbi:MAG: 3'-5' exonuclease [Bacteroidales bacterium]|nr:3'-5' exonuclease [Bacteroidales bacterium]MBP5374357.1 3'-5' exonuclease [Bacteroidales bacterium]
MELNLQRPLLFFDLESTGLNIATDGIIEISFVKVFPGGESRVKTWKIKPWDYQAHRQLPINPAASLVNGVKDEDLKDCPRFIEVLPELVEWLEGSDLAGFNSAKFDLPLLAEEIERARAYATSRLEEPASREKAAAMLKLTDGIDLHGVRMVDVQNIYHHMEPRNLRAAYRFYCGGKDFENAHTAQADTIATYEVLKGQLDRYSTPDDAHPEVLKNDVEALSKIGARSRTVDFAGRLVLNDEGEAVISFGKHKGKTARSVWESEPAYYAWIEGGDFTLDTKRQFARLKQQFIKERKQALNRPATEDELSGLAQRFNTGKLF